MRKRKNQQLQQRREENPTENQVNSSARIDLTRHGRRINWNPTPTSINDINSSQPVASVPESNGQTEVAKIAAPLLFVQDQSTVVSPDGSLATGSSPTIDEFHNSSFLSRSVILGDEFPGLDHSHSSRSLHEYSLSKTDIKVLNLYHGLDLPALQIRQSLIEAFLDKCWTWMPVTDCDTSNLSNETSVLLLQVMLLTGSLMRRGPRRQQISQTYYSRVKALIHTGHERNPLKILAALCLIQWYTPTAPKDISTDTPRFWATYAIGLAHQMGLYRQPVRRASDFGLRRRIWWTLYTRDGIMAAAHGRPRMINRADCTVDEPTIFDFSNPEDRRAQIFVSYVAVVDILADLCQLLTRHHDATTEEKQQIGFRLLTYARQLPENLRLLNPDGSARAYDFELAQLHFPFLTAVTILYRPRSMFNMSASNAAAITAANLNFRIAEAIDLRDDSCFLSSAFAWYLLVAAIPHLSCCRIPQLRTESQAALDTLEGVLGTMGSVRPAALNNLQNIRTIRKAVDNLDPLPTTRPNLESENTDVDRSPFSPADLFEIYGADAMLNYHSLATILRANTTTSNNNTTNTTINTNNQTPSAEIGISTTPNPREYISRGEPHPSIDPTIDITTDPQTATTDGEADPMDTGMPFLLGQNFEENGWMRNWVDELQLFAE